ncbi:MAG TPA: VWA domain-containing protein [Pyrinomonadaceae bacterium]|nr:VWA domain-containing protein [Pyrinomonadaceae bacterium]
MRISRTVVVTALVLAASAYSFGQQPSDSVFDRSFTQRFAGIAIENLYGKTDVQTWNSNRVRIIASRASSADNFRRLDARIRFQITTNETLRIIVLRTERESPITLSVYIPRLINLSVHGGDDSVAVSGATNALSVETQAGDIAFYLPQSANSDLSLKTIEGSITSKLQMRIFGPANTHSLDGRIGTGGSPVILRSSRGAVALLPDDVNRLARVDAQMVNDTGWLAQPAVDRSLPANEEVEDTSSTRPESVTLSKRPDSNGLDVVKIDTRLVNLNVRVTDAAGKLIPDLNKDDFEIFEGKRQQEIARFEPVTSPVNVVLLLDLSGSTQDRWKIIKKAAKQFVDTLSPNTPIAVAAFTRRFLLVSDFTLDRKLLKDRLDHTKNLHAGTAFYDATWSTLDLFKPLPDRRKAIVVMTDGVDNSISDDEYVPSHPFDELIARVMQDEITIYPIYFNTEYEVTVRMHGSDTHESYVTARGQLQRIADETGGTLFKADRAEDLEGVYQRVASELQALYSVSYNPLDKNYDGQWRDVSVKVKRGQAQARTKRGFYAR